MLLGDYALSHSISRTISRWLYEWALPRMTDALRTLHAPDGIVAILGNHDYDYDAGKTAAWLRSLGARVLVNECVVIEKAESAIGHRRSR